MKAVMLSIKPKYCELIASGKKTIEVRKTRPKLETPFKCYIYCTKPKNNAEVLWTGANCVIGKMSDQSNGKVIGEFVCDKIDKIHIPTELIYEKEVTGFNERTLNILNQSCLSYDEIVNYSGCTLNNYDPRKDWLFAWHISGFVIYDKPKELSEFMAIDKEMLKECPYRERICQNPEYCNGNYLWGGYSCSKTKEPDFDDIDFCRGGCLDVFKPLTRPPQSWCYVEVE